jgi:hypothetical protein
MNIEQRKQAIDQRNKSNFSKLISSLSEELINQAFEKEDHSSERRFEAVCSCEAVEKITQVTNLFRETYGLELKITCNPGDIPKSPLVANFKYTRHWEAGNLYDCPQRIRNRENIIMAFVFEQGLLIGYGIAVKRDNECEIEIIDVDYYSRREANLKKTLQLNEQNFDVGIGHVVVLALIQACSRPIKVDATTTHSRYLFKSLGFVHDAQSANPYILRME